MSESPMSSCLACLEPRATPPLGVQRHSTWEHHRGRVVADQFQTAGEVNMSPSRPLFHKLFLKGDNVFLVQATHSGILPYFMHSQNHKAKKS